MDRRYIIVFSARKNPHIHEVVEHNDGLFMIRRGWTRVLKSYLTNQQNIQPLPENAKLFTLKELEEYEGQGIYIY